MSDRLQLVPVHDPTLQNTAEPVEPGRITSGYIRGIITQMLDIASGRSAGIEGDPRIMVGLAAPQLGVGLRIIVVNTTAGTGTNTYEVFVNPGIIARSEDMFDGPEGCFSCGKYVWGNVSRAQAVVMEALDVDSNFVSRVFRGFIARIIQHEIDHLDGVRFPDRIPLNQPERLHWVEVDEPGEMVRYRGGEWSTWPALCPRERWLKPSV